jgi:peptidoglycan/xylan/chitin deacetylase (PgdA/CDA1 family)
MFYFVKTPGWLQNLYKDRVWEINTDQDDIYLSFDDGPHPEHTPYVLDELKKYNARATFFCIGKNVQAFPEVYRRIIEEGHAVGNHTFNHLNGWKTKDDSYLQDIKDAARLIDSKMFRPPYGKATGFQVKQLQKPAFGLKTIMWTVLSGDFDTSITREACLQNVLLNAAAGSIVVFHDSDKASEKMRYALPAVLSFYADKNFGFKKLSV